MKQNTTSQQKLDERQSLILSTINTLVSIIGCCACLACSGGSVFKANIHSLGPKTMLFDMIHRSPQQCSLLQTKSAVMHVIEILLATV